MGCGSCSKVNVVDPLAAENTNVWSIHNVPEERPGYNEGAHPVKMSEVPMSISRTLTSTSTSTSTSVGSPYPPGPLNEGAYMWRPTVPCRLFKSVYGVVDKADERDSFYEVEELELTHFLGSGAGGTVYLASYCNNIGRPSLCAVKFSGTIAEYQPDTHEAIKALLQRDKNSFAQVYEREKRALELMRPVDESQWQEFACGRLRMMQFVGFHDAAEALLLEYIQGVKPEIVVDSVKELLHRVAEVTHVQVADVKTGNLLKGTDGTTTVIDFGTCGYVGGAVCKLCGKSVECNEDDNIDAHAQEHVAEYLQKKRPRGAVSRLRLQEFCYGEAFC